MPEKSKNKRQNKVIGFTKQEMRLMKLLLCGEMGAQTGQGNIKASNLAFKIYSKFPHNA